MINQDIQLRVVVDDLELDAYNVMSGVSPMDIVTHWIFNAAGSDWLAPFPEPKRPALNLTGHTGLGSSIRVWIAFASSTASPLMFSAALITDLGSFTSMARSCRLVARTHDFKIITC